MIKPKYPKNADLSQVATSIVEHAIGEPLTPNKPSITKKSNNHHKKQTQDANKTDN
jgi:hypothetical protein